MNEQAEKLKQKFAEVFASGGKKIFIGRAPGRVNLMGEDTEERQGLSLAVALDQDVMVGVQRRQSGDLTVPVNAPSRRERLKKSLPNTKIEH